MPEPRLTRRRALRIGAATVAAGVLAPRVGIGRGPGVFELALGPEAAGAASAGGWRTTGVRRAPHRFDLIGLRWAHGPGIEAQVRARRRGGPWTRWVGLHAVAGHAPDGAALPRGTEPAWTGAADEFQLRLRGGARGLRARFVWARPAARRARARARTAAAGRAGSPGRASQATAAPPRIITRSEWGGDLVRPRADPGYGVVSLAFVHHTVTANDYGPEDSAAIVLGIARYHRDGNGWNDVGYNFLVDKYGQVFEGRAGGVELAVIGAQAQGYNAVSTGVACLGDLRSVTQTEAGMQALAQLIAWKLSLHGAPTDGKVVVTSAGGASNRYPAGAAVTFRRISGHRDGDRTTCPGDAMYGQLADLRARAGRLVGTPVSALTVRARPARVRYPASTRLTGRLGFADGSSAAGVAVQIQYQAAGAGWQAIGTAACGPDGSWKLDAALPGSGLVRAVFGGDATRAALEAPPVSVAVLPQLTLALGVRRVRAGRRVAVTGRLAPPAAELTCLLERRAGRGWVVVQRKRIPVRGGGFATFVRPRRRGLYRVTVMVPGAASRLALRSLR